MDGDGIGSPLGWLPGCEVFSKYGPADARIDMEALERNVGALPTEPNKQNARWYQLYKQVEVEPEISEAHRNFLMYRDMAVLSLPFIALAPLCLYFAGASPGAQGFAKTLARSIANANAAEGLVFAVNGAWGLKKQRVQPDPVPS